MKNNKYIKNGYDCIENCGNKVSRNLGRCHSCANKNRKSYSKETREKMSKRRKGKTLQELGHKENCKCYPCRSKRGEADITERIDCDRIHLSDCQCGSCKAKRGEFKGENNWFFGKLGEDSPSYIDGRTPISILIRNNPKSLEWKKIILKKDNFTCQDCHIKGGKLEAHHKKTFSDILSEFLQEYNQFSPIEDKETLLRLAIKYDPFWNTDNGKTLCEDCHKNYTYNKRNQM